MINISYLNSLFMNMAMTPAQFTVSYYLGCCPGSVGQMKLLGLVGFCADDFVCQPQVLYLQLCQVSGLFYFLMKSNNRLQNGVC